jgi:protein ImuA
MHQLQSNIHHLEAGSRLDDGSLIHSGCTAIDHLLPEGGYRRGALVEWVTLPRRRATRQQHLTSGGCGADFLSLLTAQQACADGGALVIVDPHSQFYPPAATAMGISFANTILVRPGSSDPNELYWAVDQALRWEAVGAVWGALDEIGERWFRRFQLSAEASGVVGLFVRPANAIDSPSWAEVQWHVTPTPDIAREPSSTSTSTRQATTPNPAHRVCELKLSRCRGGPIGRRIQIEIDTVTGSVHGRRARTNHESTPPNSPQKNGQQKTHPLPVAAQLAHSALHRRESRA